MSVRILFTETAPTEIYPLSLHDALPIWKYVPATSPNAVRTTLTNEGVSLARSTETAPCARSAPKPVRTIAATTARQDRKSTRLNSSHVEISYAVFCLKKKKKLLSDRGQV